MAPEILLDKPYNGIICDIFSLGHLLFNMATGYLAFKSASERDKLYKLIQKKKYDSFWNQVEVNINENLSKEFKDLFVGMVAYEPKERPSIGEILDHPWMKEIHKLEKEKIIDLENELRKEMHDREQLIRTEYEKMKDLQDDDADFSV